ncbi:amino acid lyase [Bifidobacterium aemilianum]|uniref:Amino acid lyase n=1 Tax=Bifidobacterium aemilianum TaxID=2493120 RepID=A0A366K9W7_9BIFI|nr:aminotransferase class I/II-fold pyridoxal phosphate-dependent enzyme [Bifidobacterium aemilianum]RBP98516.1 amino acid lyase [Bifidobacterium aemilianum]
MLSFENDYSEGCHPAILERLKQINLEKNPGYGADGYCQAARDKIRQACESPRADVWFLVGGTQTNQTVIDAITPQYAGVAAAESGHINVHEAGAIEATGHKVLTLPEHDGKIDAKELDAYCGDFYQDGNYEHMVFPGTVYISQSTEYGTIYSLDELKAISQVCKRYDMRLFVDGARLGYALSAQGNDVSLVDLARLADVIYIGGTKQGALFGEAVVFPRGDSPKHFLTLIKQHGALLAKGWLLGVQFDTLFSEDRYSVIAYQANQAADRIRQALRAKGYQLTLDNPTNQILVTMDQATIDRLSAQVKLGYMYPVDESHAVMRICTSWATSSEQVDQLVGLL